MNKIELGTSDGAIENTKRITELFPQVVTEVRNSDGEIERAVDFDALRDLLGDVAEGQRERYQFTWPGKREAKAEARRSIYKTMIPEPGKSKDWDTTENLYIEGDNLDALKILKETYAGKVKLIYIDPPYNTGHDFVYDDDFAKTRVDYDAESGEYDKEGGRLVANTEGNGRFHSDWCSMIYPRLMLARDLLSDDGAIFISIDDNESKNLRAICDEVFGVGNFKSDIAWQKRYTRSNNTVDFTTVVEHILVYSKSSSFCVNLLPRTTESDSAYTNPDNDPRGPWITSSYVNPASCEARPNLSYPIQAPDGRIVEHPTNAWKFSREENQRHISDNLLWWGADGHAQYPRLKLFLNEARGLTPINFWKHEYAGNTDMGGNDLKNLLGTKPFDFPKPTLLIKRVLEHASAKDSLVLDFFSGSATTAEAVMRKNAEDGGNRRFILVQLPEEASGGWDNLCNVGEERIRCAGVKIAAEIDEANRQLQLGAEPKPYPDLGFRVLRIDFSNFKDFYLTPGETSQESLFDFADNVKEGRSDLDLLFEVLPKLGIPYSAKIEERVLAGKKVFFVDGDKLAACFDANVGSDTIEEMAKAKPWYAVIRDSSMADDATHANYEELFRTYSPDTVPQVI